MYVMVASAVQKSVSCCVFKDISAASAVDGRSIHNVWLCTWWGLEVEELAAPAD